MAEDKKKKLGLQKDVSSIFKGVPIPSKKGGDNAQQPPQAPAAKGKRNFPALERTGNIPSPQRAYYIPELERSGNITEPEHKDKIPKLEHSSNIAEPEHKDKIPEPQSKEKTSPKSVFKESQISLIKKINQPTQLLRKDTPVKQLVVETNKKVSGPGRRQRIKNKIFAPKPGTSSIRQKLAVAMIPLLALVFIFVLRQVFWTAPSKTEGSIKNDTPGVGAAIDSSNEINWKIPAPFPISLRDPMKMNPRYNEQNQAAKPEQIVEINVNGILYSKDNPSVLIGNRIAHEGEKIAGVTIVKINQDSVEFEIDGKKWERKVQTQPAKTEKLTK